MAQSRSWKKAQCDSVWSNFVCVSCDSAATNLYRGVCVRERGEREGDRVKTNRAIGKEWSWLDRRAKVRKSTNLESTPSPPSTLPLPLIPTHDPRYKHRSSAPSGSASRLHLRTTTSIASYATASASESLAVSRKNRGVIPTPRSSPPLHRRQHGLNQNPNRKASEELPPDRQHAATIAAQCGAKQAHACRAQKRIHIQRPPGSLRQLYEPDLARGVRDQCCKFRSSPSFLVYLPVFV